MSRLERSQLLLGLQGLLAQAKFDTESSRFGRGRRQQRGGRHDVAEGSLLPLGVNPGISYRATEWFSIGVGFSFLRGLAASG